MGTIQNIVGSCTFHTNQVFFQPGMLIYTITKSCQNLLQYVYLCTYERHLYDPIYFKIKTALKIIRLKIYLKKKNKSLFQQYFNPKLS